MTLSPPEREAVEEAEFADGTAERRRKANLRAAANYEAYWRRIANGWTPPPNQDPWSKR